MGSQGCTHRAGGGCAGEHVASGHSLDVFQEQPKERQVELGYFCLLVLKKREDNVGKSPGFLQ